MYPGAHAGRCALWARRVLADRAQAALVGIAAGLIGLSLYLATLAPGLAVGLAQPLRAGSRAGGHDMADGGELATAAATLGIAHPPGYPTYLLLAHPFTRLPVGEVATRTNLFSALCAAAASALLAWTVMRATGRWAVALGAGLALAVSPLLWSQATITEVHALNAWFTAALLALLVPAPGGPAGRHNAGLALATGCLWGLSLGVHPTALFCAPVVALALWRRGRAGWLGLAGALLGLSVYLYLPLRAAADPPVNWGDPQTLDRFWWTVSGALYRPFLFGLPPADLPGRLLAWANLISRQFGRVGVLVLALGAAVLWEKDRALLGATGATVLLCSLLALGYDTTDSYLYLVPALVCLALWLGMGWDGLWEALAEAAPGRRWLPRAVALLAVILPLAAVPWRFPAQDLSADRAAYDLQDAILERAPPRAVVLSRVDAHTFSLWYFTHALGRRTDVTVVDLGLLRHDWYAASLSEPLGGSPHLLLAEDGRLESAAEALDRPVCAIVAQELGLICAHP